MTARSNLHARASLGAIAVAAVAAAATPAAAQTTIYGGGATLPSLVVRELFDFYSANVNTNYVYDYRSVGSGAGLRGFFGQDRRLFDPTLPNIDVHFAISETALVSANVVYDPVTATYSGTYVNGGRFSGTGPTDIADQANNCVAPAVGTGGPTQGTNTGGCYTNPFVENGPPIQVPLLGTGVTVTFDPVYKSVDVGGVVTNYSYNNQFPRSDASGGIRLPRDTFCAIFSGTVTEWDDPALTAANGGVPLWPSPSDPNAGTPGYNDGKRIVVVHRDDDSGTTALFTRALRAQCTPIFDAALGGPGFSARFPGSPAAAIAAGSVECRGNITPGTAGLEEAWTAPNYVFSAVNDNSLFAGGIYLRARGSEGVTTCVNTATPALNGTTIGGRVGYVSQDFALPFVNVPPFSAFAVNTFSVENRSGNFIAPDIAGITAGIDVLRAPNATNAPNPLQWVASPNGGLTGNRIADPRSATGYPIVGTTNILLYTCYGTQDELFGLARRISGSNPTPAFLNWLYASTDPNVLAILNASGFVQLPATVRDRIQANFLNGGSGALRMRVAPSGTVCSTGA